MDAERLVKEIDFHMSRLLGTFLRTYQPGDVVDVQASIEVDADGIVHIGLGNRVNA